MKLGKTLLIAATLAPAVYAAGPPGAVSRTLSLDEAIMMALAHNEAIVIQQESLIATESATLQAEGVYDPALDLEANYRHGTEALNTPFSGAPGTKAGPTAETGETLLTLTQYLPTGGNVALHADASRQTTDSDFVLLTPAYSTRIGVEYRQPLLRGLSIDPARLSLRIAAADRVRSAASLRREVTETVASVEKGYWSLASSRRAVEVREEAVHLADEQLAQTRARVEEGAAPETELSQPKAELERRRGEMYAAREAVSRDENALKRLILGATDTTLWATSILTNDDPNIAVVATASQEVDLLLQQALRDRPELDEFEAEIERRRAESAFASDTLRPGLDVFVSYDRIGLAGTVKDQDPNAAIMVTVPDWIDGGLGRSYGTLGEGRFHDTRAGIILSVPIGNRAAKGGAGIALAAQRQAEAGLDGVRKQVLSEVLDAAAAEETATQRVEAARAARQAADVQLSAERDRYGAGLSTNFLVLTRQNDFSRARLDEITALTDYRKARTEMARATGSLLDERRIQVEEWASRQGGR